MRSLSARVVAVLTLALAVLLAAGLLPAAASAMSLATGATPPQALAAAPQALAAAPAATIVAAHDNVVVKVGDNATIARGTTAKTVVVVGGNARIDGTVSSTVVVIGGNVTITGTVRHIVVVLGGNVHVLPTAQLGVGNKGRDQTAAVLLGGKLTVDPGAHVVGRTVTKAKISIGRGLGRVFAAPFTATYGVGSVARWFFQTLFFAILAVIVVAIAPRPLAAVGERVSHQPLRSFGWGVLGVLLLVPASIVILLTIIGILLLIPLWGIVLPVTFVLGFITVAAVVGEKILGASQHSRMLATVVGIVLLSAVKFVPVAGSVFSAVVWLTGFGAVLLVFTAWLSGRRSGAAAAAGAATGATAGPTSGGPAGPPRANLRQRRRPYSCRRPRHTRCP